MAKRFDPVTEEEAANLLAPGVYDFEVITAEEKERSAPGALMFKVKLDVFSGDGSSKHVYDYLGTDFLKHKLRHFCFATGLAKEYESGEVYDTDMRERSGKVKIGIDDDPGYGKKNVAQDYIVPPDQAERSTEAKDTKIQGVPSHQSAAARKVQDDDEIPF